MSSLFLFHRPVRSSVRSGFTLVELLTVITIVAIMTGLGVASFRGGSNSQQASGAADAASSIFSQARTQAILRNTPAAVIVDTNSTSTACFHRVMVVYLDSSITASHPAATWDQASPWVIFPGVNCFNPIYSNPFGTLTLDSSTVPNGGSATPYAYYAFDATGQAYLLPSGLTANNTVVNTTATTASQFVVSPGSVSNGKFTERGTNLRYGFYLFPLGRIAFFQDMTNDLSNPPTNAWQ